MKFSLICATVNRTLELRNLLESLSLQSYKEFELIIIDQNADNRLVPLVNEFSSAISIVHIKSDIVGLSKARNIGLNRASGKILAFPDDDCQYPSGLLESVHELYAGNPKIDCITGMCLDSRLNKACSRYSRNSGRVNRFNVWTRGSSISIFVKTDLLKRNNLYFNEKLGLGSEFPSGEETDLLLHVIKSGGYILYEPTVIISHPVSNDLPLEELVARGYCYGLGFGKVMRIHKYPFWFVGYQFIKPAIGMIVFLFLLKLKKIKYYQSSLQGRVTGFCR